MMYLRALQKQDHPSPDTESEITKMQKEINEMEIKEKQYKKSMELKVGSWKDKQGWLSQIFQRKRIPPLIKLEMERKTLL